MDLHSEFGCFCIFRSFSGTQIEEMVISWLFFFFFLFQVGVHDTEIVLWGWFWEIGGIWIRAVDFFHLIRPQPAFDIWKSYWRFMFVEPWRIESDWRRQARYWVYSLLFYFLFLIHNKFGKGNSLELKHEIIKFEVIWKFTKKGTLFYN